MRQSGASLGVRMVRTWPLFVFLGLGIAFTAALNNPSGASRRLTPGESAIARRQHWTMLGGIGLASLGAVLPLSFNLYRSCRGR